jgi:hypothetical protein
MPDVQGNEESSNHKLNVSNGKFVSSTLFGVDLPWHRPPGQVCGAA